MMAQTVTGLSPRAAHFLSQLAATGRSVFRFDEMQDLWPEQTSARQAFSRLEKGGWLRRIERGLYLLLPLSAGPERAWTEDALVIATHLVPAGAVAYWSALRFWGFTEQLPRAVCVQSPRRKSKSYWTIAGVPYQLVAVAPRRFFGIAEKEVDSQRIRVTDRAKTMVDAADRPDLSGGIWQLAEALQGHWSALDWATLNDYLRRFASGATYKRLGYLVDMLDLPIPQREQWLGQWREQLTEGIADLEPGAGGGTTHRHWRIRDNIGLAAALKGADQ